jgi:hypothetical protein
MKNIKLLSESKTDTSLDVRNHLFIIVSLYGSGSNAWKKCSDVAFLVVF